MKRSLFKQQNHQSLCAHASTWAVKGLVVERRYLLSNCCRPRYGALAERDKHSVLLRFRSLLESPSWAYGAVKQPAFIAIFCARFCHDRRYVPKLSKSRTAAHSLVRRIRFEHVVTLKDFVPLSHRSFVFLVNRKPIVLKT
jgi:hypothetical protein